MSEGVYEMKVLAPKAAKTAIPGQFAQLFCGEGTTLRRPISIADASKEEGTLRFCYDLRGKGTEMLSKLKEKDTLDILAPLGKGFSTDIGGKILLVGGGIGIYPLIFAAHNYRENADAALGFRNVRAAAAADHLRDYGVKTSIITDDGSSGRKGLVTVIVNELLDQNKYDAILTCGPKPMMEAVAKIAIERGIFCEVSLEERMACGVGACMGCVCSIMTENGPTYKRVCKDGPVFNAKEVIF